MDYEKKYKEALEWARKVMQGKVGFVLDEVLEKFPELKESEDERIKKMLRDVISQWRTGNQAWCSDVKLIDATLAWLEKQESVGEIVSRCKTSWYNEGKIQGQIEGLSDDEKYQQGWHDALEKQGEQKSIWHNEDEEPKDGSKVILCQIGDETFSVFTMEYHSNDRNFHVTSPLGNDYIVSLDYPKIRWAYPEDLLPSK